MLDPNKPEDLATLETDKGENESAVDAVVDPGVKDKLATEIARKKHWRNKAIDPATGKSYRDLYEEMRKAQPPANPSGNPPAPPAPPAPADPNAKQGPGWDDFHRLSLSQKGYSQEQIQFITTYASGAKKQPLEVLEDPIVKGTLEHLQQKSRQADGRPHPTSPNPSPAPALDISKMSPRERSEKLSFQSWRGRRNQG